MIAAMGITARGSGIAVVLGCLSFVFGEMLGAATPPTQVFRPERLLLLVFYGSAAILIRETVRRKGLGWPAIFGLGAVYALVEEGLVLQTIFNPEALDLDMAYGRWLGVNWLWAIANLGHHTILSIVIPILVVESLVRDRREKPWLDKRGYIVAAVLFVASAAALRVIFTIAFDYNASIWVVLSLSLLLAGATALILRRPNTAVAQSGRRAPRPALVGITAAATAFTWMCFEFTVFMDLTVSAAWILGGQLAVASVVGALFIGWTRRDGWTNRHQIAAATGIVIVMGMFGLLIAVGDGHPPEAVAQVLLIVILAVGLVAFRKRVLGERGPDGPPQNDALRGGDLLSG